MFCITCGTQLKDTAKFCGGCGTRVEASPTPAPARPARIELAPLASGLAECRVEIIDVESDEPDDDGEVRLTVKYTVSNETDEDWEYIETRAQLLSAAGVVIDESLDTNEQTVSAGEMQEFEVGFWGVREQLLGSPLEQAGVILSVVACGGMQHSLGEFEVPSEPFSALGLPPGQMGDAIRILGGALWKNAPDDDGDCSVTVKVLVQNLTAHSVPELKLLAPVTDRQGREVVEAGTSDVLRPGAVAVIAGSGYAREKKFAGAKVELGIRAYPALAAGICQRDDSLPATPSLPASFGPEVMRPYAKALSTSDEIGHLMYEDCAVFYVSLNRYARDRYELVLDLRLREAFDDPDVWIYLEDHERVEYSGQANNFLKEMGAYEALGLRNEMVDRCRMILDQDLETGSDEASGTESVNMSNNLADEIVRLISSCNPDAWVDEFGDEKTWNFKDGTPISCLGTDHDDASTWLEIYDEMDIKFIESVDGVELSTAEAADALSEKGPFLEFKHVIDFHGVKIIYRYLQFGEGEVAGHLIDIPERVDKAWLAKWISNAIENEWTIS